MNATDYKLWQNAWRVGFAPQLLDAELVALRDALRDDDPRLMQGGTVSVRATAGYSIKCACAIAFCGWQGGLETFAEVEEFFAALCFEADQRLEEPAGCRWFLNWFDETPRDQMRQELLIEVEATLAARQEQPVEARP